MVVLTLEVIDREGNIACTCSGENFVDLVYGHAYEEGDRIRLTASESNLYLHWQVDDGLGDAFVYLKGEVIYQIPFGEQRRSYSPKAFHGDRHYMYVELAGKEEIECYRNLALNPADQRFDVQCFPHASANVETRGEATFAARNAIDGVRANLKHGSWPYESWGINQQDDAVLKVDFGRKVRTDKVVLYTRSDFPHDNWWVRVTLTFSDGSAMEFPLEKSTKAHVLTFPERETEWVELGSLIKADDPSPFPALSQIEVYGKDIL